MKNLVIKKWIEPYRLLETVKLYCDFTDLTFDGMNKIVQKEKMYSLLKENEKSFALYMKNVNKFYVFTPKEEFDLQAKLVEVFAFENEDLQTGEDSEQALSLIDMGKAEASFLNIN